MISINLKVGIGLIIFFFVFYPLLVLFLCKNSKKLLKIISIISFVCYIFLLSILVFGNITIENDIFKVNLKTNAPWLSLNFCVASFSTSNILYNLIMMFPIPAFIFANSNYLFSNSKSFINKSKNIFLKSTIISFIISLLIELLQFILPVFRTTEILDLVLNSLSGVLGFFFFFFSILIYKKAKEKKQ